MISCICCIYQHINIYYETYIIVIFIFENPKFMKKNIFSINRLPKIIGTNSL